VSVSQREAEPVVTGAGPDGPSGLTRDLQSPLGRLFAMLRVRRLEERAAELYTQGRIGGFLHLAVGEEAVSAGVIPQLAEEDRIVASYREHGHALLRGMPSAVIFAELFGRVSGCSRGRGGSMHLFDAGRRFYGGTAIVAAGLPLAVGLALGDRLRGEEAITACFFGDGAVDEGGFHESANLAALWKLPVLFVCENNRYAMGTAIERHLSVTDIAAKGACYGIASAAVDGMDVDAMARAATEAVGRVRHHGEPFLLEARTYRFRAHSMYDPQRYRSQEEVARWRSRDPISTCRQRLEETGQLSAGAWSSLEEEVEREMQEAVAAAEAGGLEPVEDLTRDVLAEAGPES